MPLLLAAQAPARPADLTYEQRMGCRYGAIPADPTAAPTLTAIPIPKFAGSWAVWGATGRDRRGHVWFAVSAHRVKLPSAHLFEYDPVKKAVTDRGDVVTALKKAGVHRPRESQVKIHAKDRPGGRLAPLFRLDGRGRRGVRRQQVPHLGRAPVALKPASRGRRG